MNRIQISTFILLIVLLSSCSRRRYAHLPQINLWNVSVKMEKVHKPVLRTSPANRIVDNHEMKLPLSEQISVLPNRKLREYTLPKTAIRSSVEQKYRAASETKETILQKEESHVTGVRKEVLRPMKTSQETGFGGAVFVAVGIPTIIVIILVAVLGVDVLLGILIWIGLLLLAIGTLVFQMK